jgi:hypothetical protein
MSQADFRTRLIQLLDEFLSTGGDPWWCFSELATAGTELTDALRCDLLPVDVIETEPPF